jgi:uncharacterized protein (DUF1330 family)
MSYYFAANIRIHDEEEYKKYLERAGEIFNKYKGSYLAIDDHPLTLEGNWEYTRVVLIRFDSRPDFDAWYQSAEYQEILKYRLSAAECDSILIKG